MSAITDDELYGEALYNRALSRIRQLEKQCEVLAAEVDRMRPVVEAAETYCAFLDDNKIDPLSDAVDEYQASNPK